MDGSRFDRFAKALAIHFPRRFMVAGLVGATAAVSARPLTAVAEEVRTFCDPKTGECVGPELPTADEHKEIAVLSREALATMPPPGDESLIVLPDEVASFVENTRRVFQLGTLAETLSDEQIVDLAELFEGLDLGLFTGIFLCGDPEGMLATPEAGRSGIRALPAAYFCNDCFKKCKCKSWAIGCKLSCNSRNLWCQVNCLVG